MSIIRGLTGLVARIAICLACLATLFSVTELKQSLTGEFPTIEDLSLIHI